MRRLRRRGATHDEILADLAGGLVESGLRQIHYGDRDSQGYLQQRPSQGWGAFKPGKRGIIEDTDDFLARAKRLRGSGRRPWEIAADVQRPAEQYRTRYRDRMHDAVKILHALGGAGGGGRGADVGGGSAAGDTQLGAFDPGSVSSPDLLALLGPPESRVPAGGLPAPMTDARSALALPQGYQGVVSGGGPAPRPSPVDALGAMQGQDTMFGSAQSLQAQRKAARERLGKGGLQGGSPTALVNSVISWAGQELGLKPGSRDRSPGENAAAGGSPTSDHLEGPGLKGREAIDLPTSPAQGGWGQYRKVARKLGLKPAASGFTEGTIRVGKRRVKVQVIFGEANHHGDHIHVGFHLGG